MKNLCLFALGGSFSALNAQATTLSGAYVYEAVYNFSKVAFSKSVKSVTVHTGVSVFGGCGASPSLYWDNVQDVTMKDAGDHFMAAAKLVTAASECNSVKGPMVQYWVSFTDGSSMVTDASLIPVTNQLSGFGPNSALNLKVEVKAAADVTADDSYSHAIMVNESFAD
jgi:hypothetical protein